MEISLSGKRALVTGAAQGIGLCIVKKLVDCGAQVVALDVKEDKLKEALKEIPRTEPVVCDLSDWDSIGKALQSIGRVHLVVNNAGVTGEEGFRESDVNRILDVNLKGVMAVCKHVVNDWISEKVKGAIVNICSTAAIRPLPSNTVYCASKAAVLQYTRCLALECAPKGIRVNAVSPGGVDTDMTRSVLESPGILEYVRRNVPLSDTLLLDPEDIANAIAFLLCDKVTRRITGVNLNVDAGFLLT